MVNSKYIDYYINNGALELDRNIPLEYLEELMIKGYKLRLNIDKKEILPHIYVTIRNKYIVNIIVKYIDSIEINQIQKRAIAVDIIINDKEFVFNILDYNTILELEREFDTGLLNKLDKLEVLSNVDIVRMVNAQIKNKSWNMMVKTGGKYFEVLGNRLIEIQNT